MKLIPAKQLFTNALAEAILMIKQELVLASTLHYVKFLDAINPDLTQVHLISIITTGIIFGIHFASLRIYSSV